MTTTNLGHSYCCPSVCIRKPKPSHLFYLTKCSDPDPGTLMHLGLACLR